MLFVLCFFSSSRAQYLPVKRRNAVLRIGWRSHSESVFLHLPRLTLEPQCLTREYDRHADEFLNGIYLNGLVFRGQYHFAERRRPSTWAPRVCDRP